MSMRGLWWVVLALGACKGPCEKLCVRLADYADECGFSVPDGEVDACIDTRSELSSTDREACRDFGTPEAIRAEWSCEDLAVYFGANDDG